MSYGIVTSGLQMIPATGAPVLQNVAVLDNFEGVNRTVGDGLLWRQYTGVADLSQTATVAFDSVKVKNGTQSLHHHNPGDGRSYPEFHPQMSSGAANWNFMNQMLVQGSWFRGAWNRMTFWIYMPTTIVVQGANGHHTEIGLYARGTNEGTGVQGADHCYCYLNNPGGVWTKVVVSERVQHIVSTGPKSDVLLVTTGGSADPTLGQTYNATGDGVSNLWDSNTRMYMEQLIVAAGDTFMDDFTFYKEVNQDDDPNIGTLEVSWNPSTKVLHAGFCRRSSKDASGDTTYTGKYALSDINQLGFSNATTFGTVAADGNLDYVNKFIEGTVDLTGQQYVWIAVQKQGSTAFRQTYLPINAGGI